MAIDFQAVTVRHERRLRLFFTNTVAGGAFNVALYTVTNTDSSGVDPAVVGAYPIVGAPMAVELALGADLVEGGLYAIRANGVPAIDLSTCPDTTLPSRTPASADVPNVERPRPDRDALIYGVDLVWSADDFAEDPTGDLAVVSGRDNYTGAIQRRLQGEPLPWDADYSPRARGYVDAPAPTLDELKADVVRQIGLDPRTAEVQAVDVDTTDPAAPVIAVDVVPIGDRRATRVDATIGT